MPILLAIAKQVIIYILSTSVWRWLRTTRVGLKLESFIMAALTKVSNKLDIELIKKNARFSKHYPSASSKIKDLEERLSYLESRLDDGSGK
jgi:hypothetical protein